MVWFEPGKRNKIVWIKMLRKKIYWHCSELDKLKSTKNTTSITNIYSRAEYPNKSNVQNLNKEHYFYMHMYIIWIIFFLFTLLPAKSLSSNRPKSSSHNANNDSIKQKEWKNLRLFCMFNKIINVFHENPQYNIHVRNFLFK